MTRTISLKITLILIGSVIMYMGLDRGLGGIPTLGWLSEDSFFTVTNETVFNVHDSHIRFLGGIWFSVGAVFFLGAFKQEYLRTTMVLLCAAIAISGVFRLSGLAGGEELSAAVIPSMALELIAFPLLAWWISGSKSQKREACDVLQHAK